MTIEISQLDHTALKKLQKELASELKKRESNRLKEAREEIRAIEQKYGMSIEQILAGKKSEGRSLEKNKVEPKYRNPGNPEQVWTGRGKKPSWYEQAIQSGATEDSLLI